MMLYLKFFPISALTAKNKRLCLDWLQIELPKELNYWLLFVYIVKAKIIIFIWWDACVCRFACVDLRVSICVCGKFGKSVRRSRFCILWNSHAGQDQPVDTRISESYSKKEPNKRSSSDGTERWCCTTGPGSQVIRWTRIQLHREGVMLVDMMPVYLMWAWKGDDVLKSREHRRVKSNRVWCAECFWRARKTLRVST